MEFANELYEQIYNSKKDMKKQGESIVIAIRV